MGEIKRFEFDKQQAYKLIAVTDKEGNDKTHSQPLYADAEGCIAVNLRYDEGSDYNGFQRMHLDFVQDEKGNWINRGIHTSSVYEVKPTEKGIAIHTHNSIYVLENAVLKDTPICTNKNTIELYLSLDDRYHFGKGFYWDENGEPHELVADINVGMFTDTVLIGLPDKRIGGDYICRYYYRSDIKFYDTLYHQQDYSKPMLIHNTSKDKPLQISFEFYDKKWTLAPGESKQIMPFNPMGSDE